jgi:adhesin transport system membrane fusion protein
LSEGQVGLRDRVDRTSVIAPLKGTIKKLKINTLGGVVQPGMDLMEIVPLEDTLLVEAKVSPKDIAFLRPGLDAIVKITAYDFTIYGGLHGKVEQISADSIQDEEGNSFYLVRVRTEKSYLGDELNALPIIPGMLASADIITGKKSVLDYLLKPILRARQSALRER